MHPFLADARAKQSSIIASIRELVECESPSDHPKAVNQFVDLVAAKLSRLGRVRTLPGGRFGKHLQCDINLTGAQACDGQILVLGHSDTVWPLGTLESMPFLEKDGRLCGPGVLDMKAGIAFFIAAIETLRELNHPVRRKILLQLNADEEMGSESSRSLTEAAARQSAAVLVLEPGTGLEGRLKTARKGTGNYSVTIQGRAAHAGLDFEKGANAIVELARQIERIANFTDVDRGLTVNAGLIRGGSRTNVVPAEARVDIDIRVAKLGDAAALEKKFRALRAVDKRCTIEIAGGLNRPPMERSAGIRKLFGTAKTLAKEIGVNVRESESGGGSDGNFTAALGIPTLDGLGGVGEGAHAVDESILIDRIADRTALLALLLGNL